MLGTFLWALPQLLQRLDPVIFYPVVRAATFAVGYLFLHDWRRQEQAQIPAGPSLQIAAFLGSLMCPSFPRYVFLPFMASLVQALLLGHLFSQETKDALICGFGEIG